MQNCIFSHHRDKICWPGWKGFSRLIFMTNLWVFVKLCELLVVINLLVCCSTIFAYFVLVAGIFVEMLSHRTPVSQAVRIKHWWLWAQLVNVQIEHVPQNFGGLLPIIAWDWSPLCIAYHFWAWNSACIGYIVFSKRYILKRLHIAKHWQFSA